MTLIEMVKNDIVSKQDYKPWFLNTADTMQRGFARHQIYLVVIFIDELQQ